MGALHVHSLSPSNLSQLGLQSFSQNQQGWRYNRQEVGSTDISLLLDLRNIAVLPTLCRYYRTPMR
jgi:hypothetical protein